MAPPPRPLLDRIRAQDSGPDGARPIVTLEDFFEGNDDLGSIGCNLTDHPGIDRFYAALRSVRARPDVQEVLIGITEDMGDEEWPFSDTVYVLTSAPAPEVLQWLAELQPDEIGAPGDFPALPPTAPVPRPGFVVWTLSWD
jgi:hypothetical protein